MIGNRLGRRSRSPLEAAHDGIGRGPTALAVSVQVDVDEQCDGAERCGEPHDLGGELSAKERAEDQGGDCDGEHAAAGVASN